MKAVAEIAVAMGCGVSETSGTASPRRWERAADGGHAEPAHRFCTESLRQAGVRDLLRGFAAEFGAAYASRMIARVFRPTRCRVSKQVKARVRLAAAPAGNI